MAGRNRLIGTITTGGTTPAQAGAGLTASVVARELSRITPRDRQILDLLDQHGTFTTEQITALTFGSVDRARNRLNTLRARDVLDRFRHYHHPGSQSWRWVLGPVGAAILAASHGQPLPRPGAVREAGARLATSPTLAHRLAVNGWFVALLAHARTRDDVRLSQWWNEARCREAAGNLVRPDGHGVWHAGGRVVPFWLEMDLGTEPVARVTGKLTGYAHLAGTRHGYPVLFWLPSAAREANVGAALSRTGPPAGVLVATGSADTTDRDDPAGAVWRIPGHPGRVRLADLPVPGGAP